AEDGIRDLIVTGVQTCALPISVDDAVRQVRVLATGAAVLAAIGAGLLGTLINARLTRRMRASAGLQKSLDEARDRSDHLQAVLRSEERRVGKEGRWWGWAEVWK